jgi:hypothetical protein
MSLDRLAVGNEGRISICRCVVLLPVGIKGGHISPN